MLAFSSFEIAGRDFTVKQYSRGIYCGYKKIEKLSVEEQSKVSMRKKELKANMRLVDMEGLNQLHIDDLDLYEYEVGIMEDNFGQIEDYKQRIKRDYRSYERYKQSVKRAKKSLIDIINCNIGKHKSCFGKIEKPKFVTLTYHSNMTNWEKLREDYKSFIQKLQYYFSKQKKAWLKSLAVYEEQKRGALHMHIIFFNLPFIPSTPKTAEEYSRKTGLPLMKSIQEIWNYGFCDAKTLKGTNRGVALYMSKYLGKQISEEDFPKSDKKHKKRYFCSQNLKRPLKIYNSHKLSREELNALKDICKYSAKKYKNKEGQEISSFSEADYDIIYSGEIQGKIAKFNCELADRKITEILEILGCQKMKILECNQVSYYREVFKVC